MDRPRRAAAPSARLLAAQNDKTDGSRSADERRAAAESRAAAAASQISAAAEDRRLKQEQRAALLRDKEERQQQKRADDAAAATQKLQQIKEAEAATAAAAADAERRQQERLQMQEAERRRVEAEERQRAEAAHRKKFPPSAADGGATSDDASFLGILRRAADGVLEMRPKHSAAYALVYAPLRVEEPSDRLLAFVRTCRDLLHGAWLTAVGRCATPALHVHSLPSSADSAPAPRNPHAVLSLSATDHMHIPKSRRAEAEQLFAARAGSSESYLFLRMEFARLHAQEPPSLQFAFNWLWGRAITCFRVENLQPPKELVAALVATERVHVRGSNRGVSGYLAGWALARELKRVTKVGRPAPRAERLLRRLVQPREQALPADDDATAMISARELFGGLTRPRPELTTIVALTISELWSELTVSKILEHGNNAYDRAATLAVENASVRGALVALMLGNGDAVQQGGGAATDAQSPPAEDSFGDAMEEELALEWELELEAQAMGAAATQAEAEAEAEAEEAEAERAAAEAELAADEAERAADEAVVGGALLDTGADATDVVEDIASEEEAEPAGGAEEDAAIDELLADAELARSLADALIRRILNASAKDYVQWAAVLVGMVRSDDSVALRSKLKAAQIKAAKKDASSPVLLRPAHLSLARPALFSLLEIVISEASAELSKLTLIISKQLVLACVRADSEALREVPEFGTTKDVRVIADALERLLPKCAEANGHRFWRPGKLTAREFQTKKK